MRGARDIQMMRKWRRERGDLKEVEKKDEKHGRGKEEMKRKQRGRKYFPCFRPSSEYLFDSEIKSM